MPRSTLKEVDEAMKKYHEAIIEMLKADQAEDEAKLRKTRAHYQLQSAKQLVANLNLHG